MQTSRQKNGESADIPQGHMHYFAMLKVLYVERRMYFLQSV